MKYSALPIILMALIASLMLQAANAAENCALENTLNPYDYSFDLSKIDPLVIAPGKSEVEFSQGEIHCVVEVRSLDLNNFRQIEPRVLIGSTQAQTSGGGFAEKSRITSFEIKNDQTVQKIECSKFSLHFRNGITQEAVNLDDLFSVMKGGFSTLSPAPRKTQCLNLEPA